MSAVCHPILTWGRCSHTWGHGRPGCSPTGPLPPRARGSVQCAPDGRWRSARSRRSSVHAASGGNTKRRESRCSRPAAAPAARRASRSLPRKQQQRPHCLAPPPLLLAHPKPRRWSSTVTCRRRCSTYRSCRTGCRPSWPTVAWRRRPRCSAAAGPPAWLGVTWCASHRRAVARRSVTCCRCSSGCVPLERLRSALPPAGLWRWCSCPLASWHSRWRRHARRCCASSAYASRRCTEATNRARDSSRACAATRRRQHCLWRRRAGCSISPLRAAATRAAAMAMAATAATAATAACSTCRASSTS